MNVWTRRCADPGFRISTGYWKLFVCCWWEVRDRHSLSFAASEHREKILWKSIKYHKIFQSIPEWRTNISVWLQPGRALMTCCLLVLSYANNTKITVTIYLTDRQEFSSFIRKLGAFKGSQGLAKKKLYALHCIMGNVVSSLLSKSLQLDLKSGYRS